MPTHSVDSHLVGVVWERVSGIHTHFVFHMDVDDQSFGLGSSLLARDDVREKDTDRKKRDCQLYYRRYKD